MCEDNNTWDEKKKKWYASATVYQYYDSTVGTGRPIPQETSIIGWGLPGPCGGNAAVAAETSKRQVKKL